MSEAIKPTPGVWSVKFFEGTSWNGPVFDAKVSTDDFLICTADLAYSEYPDSRQEIKANFELFAEAGNVHNTTGLTPRQLVERVKELEEVLSSVVERFGPTVDELIFSKRMAINKARIVLSTPLPNTVAETPK